MPLTTRPRIRLQQPSQTTSVSVRIENGQMMTFLLIAANLQRTFTEMWTLPYSQILLYKQKTNTDDGKVGSMSAN